MAADADKMDLHYGRSLFALHAKRQIARAAIPGLDAIEPIPISETDRGHFSEDLADPRILFSPTKHPAGMCNDRGE
jgi:hypothetical protein